LDETGKKSTRLSFVFDEKKKSTHAPFYIALVNQKKTAAKKERDVNGQLDKTNGWFKNILL